MKPSADRPELEYQPALEGLRGVAVAAVLLYHGGVSWASGGFLGVDAFFVLSGYLITSLLVKERRVSGTIRIGRFWSRRARRLLPALFCLFAVVAIHAVVVGPNAAGAVPGLGSDELATLLYVGNWHQIWVGGSYFAVTGPVSPLQHTWSLAIEEQFYLVWPVVLIGGGWLLARFRGTPGRAGPDVSGVGFGASVAVAAAVASAVEMAVLYGHSGLDRVYYGTDTRAQELLVGAALALFIVWWRSRHGALGAPRPARRAVIEVLGVCGFGTVAASVVIGNGDSSWLYHFGYLGLDLCVAMSILAATLLPRSGVSRALSIRPLRSLGKISYGVYLWHLPLFLWLDSATTGVSGTALLAVRLSVTLVVATASYFLVEQPFRTGQLPRVAVRASVPAGIGVAVVSVVLASGVPPAGLSTLDAPAQAAVRPIAACRPAASASGSASGSVPATVRPVGRLCPLRVLLVGDSMALTLGMYQARYVRSHFGAEVVNDATLGCGFVTAGEVIAYGAVYPEGRACARADDTWRAAAAALGAQVVVVEMGYWDCFDRIIDGTTVHIGEPAFDHALSAGIERFVRIMGAGGARIVFLTVPPVDPAVMLDGSSQPSANPGRWALINQMLAAAGTAHPGHVAVVDIGRIVAPGGHFAATLNGRPCRWPDGVHFTPYCGRIVQPAIFGAVKGLFSG